MKRIVFFVLLIVFTAANAQQNINWDAKIGGTDTEYANAVDTSADGSMYAAGLIRSHVGTYVMQYYNPADPLSGDAWLVKYNKFGVIQWSGVFGGTANDEFYDVKATPDGGAIAVGRSASTDGNITNNKGGEDIIVVKYDAGGNIQWHQNYGTNFLDGARCVVVLPDGTYVLGCYSNGNNQDLTGGKGGRDIWLIQLSSAGTIMRKKNFGGSSDDEPFDVKLYNGNSWVVAGYSSSINGDVTGNHGSQDMWVLKLDENWALQAQKCFGGSQQDQGNGVVVLPDGFLIAGRTFSNNGDVVGAKGSQDAWMLKTDLALNIQWKRNYGGSGIDQFNAVALMPDGNVLGAAETQSTNGDIISNAGVSDAWLLKINTADGDTIWTKTYGASKGDRASDVLVWGNNDFLFAGMYGDPATSSGSLFSQLWLATSKTIAVAAPLPVKLLSFSGKNNGNTNLLQWKTAEEIQSKTFVVQRSNDGIHFSDIGTVAATGNSNTTKTYQFADVNPFTRSWYQLKMVDIDGKFTYSQVIMISKEKETAVIKLYPSLVRSKVNVVYPSNTDDEIIIVISDAGGKRIKEEKRTVGTGSNTIGIDVGRLAAGNYFLTIYAGEERITKQFVK